MEQGDDCSFKILLKDAKGKILKSSASDTFTIRVRRKDKPTIVLTKTSSPIYIEENGVSNLYNVFEFEASDTINVDYGDYIYDVTLDTSNGKRYTVVRNSPFILSMSVEYNNSDVKILYPSEFKNNYLSPTPLICLFDYVSIPRDEEDNTLIIF